MVVLCLSVYLFRHCLILFLTAQAPWDRHLNHQQESACIARQQITGQPLSNTKRSSASPHSAANATGRSRTVLNRNFLVAKEKYELSVFRDKLYTYLSIGTAGLEPATINSLEHGRVKRLLFPLSYVPSQRAMRAVYDSIFDLFILPTSTNTE